MAAFNVTYDHISNATMGGLMTALETANISYSKILTIFHDGTNYICAYIKSQ